MFFVFKAARLEWEESKGYKHPREDKWVEDYRQCLKGWIEEDVEKRGHWGALMTRLDDFWPRVQENNIDLSELGAEVIFE